MIPDALRSSSPPPAVRAMLLIEVLVLVAVVMGIVWLSPDTAPDRSGRWYVIILWTVAFVLPVGANVLHGDRLRDGGLRVDNLPASVRQATGVTAIMAAVVVAGGVVGGGWHFEHWSRFAARSGQVLAVTFAQQYMLQAFMLRRLRQAGLGPAWAVAVAAALFAAVHAPNIVLVAVTAVAAIAWCCLFLRHANLLVLSLSHAVLSLGLYYAWPKSWHLALAVGPKALDRMREYWGW